MTQSDTAAQVYGLRRCDTCVKARKWLDAQGIDYVFVDYRDQPVDAAALTVWAAKLGGWDKLVNRASTTWRNLPEGDRQPANDGEWLALVQAHPTLVRRPVLVTPDGEVSVGYKEPVWAARFGV